MRECVACGRPVMYRTSQTCGDPFCWAVLVLNPDLRVRRRGPKPAGGWMPNGHGGRRPLPFARLLPEDLEAGSRIAVDLRVDLEEDPVGVRDRRGDGRPGAQRDVWGRFSRVMVTLRVIGKRPGEAALVIHRQPGEHVGALVRSKLVFPVGDLLMAWKCGCPYGQEMIYEQPEDLPDIDGYWGACPVCGAAPIEVITDG